jgi:UDP-N-acetylmuramyl-tripeptide synthetase
MAMSLRHLVCGLTPLRVAGSLDREVAGIAYDSRRVAPGMVFVAWRGRRCDGHDFISPAIDRGASAVICERAGIFSPRVTILQVADARQALAQVAAAFHGHPSRHLTVIGVTGTNGKTCVAFLVKHLLQAAGVSCGLISSVHHEVGERRIPAQRTTPEALEIQELLAHMRRAGCQACVLEVSSHALDQHRVDAVAFDLGILTNLSPEHLDYHGTLERYAAAKRRLFTALGRRPAPGQAVLNRDDPFGARLAREELGAEVVTYGRHASALVQALRCRLSAGGAELLARTPRGRLAARLPLIGRHHIANALAAIGAGSALGIDLALLRDGLNTMPQIPGRLERIAAGQPFQVFVDHAHTERALQHVLQTLREVTPGRLLLAFGCGGDRDPTKRAPMGRVAAALADWTIITTDNPRHECPQAIAAEIESGFAGAPPSAYRVELDRRSAIEAILTEARPGDTILIAGKGHETYQEFEDVVVPFDDRLQLRETLEQLGWTPATEAPEQIPA